MRELIETISVTPASAGEPTRLVLSGNLAALLREPSGNNVTVSVVAVARNGYYSTGLLYGSLCEFPVSDQMLVADLDRCNTDS